MYGAMTIREPRRRALGSRGAVAIGTVLLAVLLASPALAQTTYYVPGDYATIQEAYTAAVAGDEIIVATNTYNEHDIVVKSGVSLRSATGLSADVIVDAQGLGRGFSVTGAAAGTEIVGITITYGIDNAAIPDSKGGGIYCVNSILEVRDCIITLCQAYGDGGFGGFGGGIAASSSSLTLVDCDFIDNDAHYTAFGGEGGGLSVEGGDVSATGCDFELNTAGYRGGAIYSTASPASFTDCTFNYNTANNSGGGAYVENSPDFDVCEFFVNSASGADGGAIRGDVGTINGCLFTYNWAGGAGGAVMGTVSTFSNCQLSQNSAPEGGGVAVAGVGNFTRCLFTQNEANAGDGGAVWTILTADYTFTNCTFAENSGTGGCGGICVDHTSQVALDKCIVAFSTSGVGVECQDSGVATLTCTDVYGNDGGDWVGCILGQQGNDFNFSLDPVFCYTSTPSAPYSLRSNSPCVVTNNPDCGEVGYVGIGCLGPTPSEFHSEWTWAGTVTNDEVIVCPAGDGASYIEVTVRDRFNSPVEGAAISLTLTGDPCPSINYCALENVVTNASGYAAVYPHVGLQAGFAACCEIVATVGATYLDEEEVPIPHDGTSSSDTRVWRSYDLNGDGVVNGGSGWGDYQRFADDYAAGRCRADFNGDGSLNIVDQANFLNHSQNHVALRVVYEGETDGVVDLGSLSEGTVQVEELTLENWGAGTVNWQLTESCPWLGISPSSGSLVAIDQDPPDPDAVTTVDFTINTTGLAPGPYECSVDVVGGGPHECFTADPIVVSLEVVAGPTFVYWDGGGDGFTWEDGSNWDPDGVPGSNDNVVVELDGDYTVYYNSTSGIHGLTHGATNGVQTLDIQTGTFGVTDGAVNSQTIVVRGGATFDASAGGDTAQVINETSGTFQLDNGDLTGSGSFTNRGHLRKTGNLASHITMDFENELPGRAELPLVSVEAGTLSFEGDTEINGRMTVNSGATAITSGHFRIISNEVTVEAGGEFVVADTVVVTSTGALDVSGVLSVEPGGLLLNSGDVSIRAGGALTVDGEVTNETAGQLLNGGLVNIPEGGLLTNGGYFEHGENGILTGGGTIDNTAGVAGIKGLVAPGDGLGTLTFLGSFVQSQTSEISLEIGGYGQGTTYDLLDISGVATLDGAVELSFTGGFEPVVDDSFHMITHAGAGPGGTAFDCYAGLMVSGSLYMEPLHLTGEFVMYATGGATGNSSPVAIDDDASVTGYQPITIDILANDSDPDLNDLRVILLTNTTLNGIAYINEDDLVVSYAAVPGFAGQDSFDYVVTDCYGGADIGRVRINVTAPPAVWSVPDDSPTIAGALALAAPGDTVVIACGIYYESDVTVPSGVVLTSETGVSGCVTIDAAGRAGGGLLCTDADTTTVIRGITVTGGSGATLGGGLYCLRSSPRVFDCVFEGNAATSGGGVACDDNSFAVFVGCRIIGNVSTTGGGVYCSGGSSASFSQCTVVGNTAPLAGGSGLYAGDGTHLVLENTILAFGIDGEAVVCGGTGTATFVCSDVFGNAGGDWTGCISGQGAIDGNFSLDPAFCDTTTGDYNLSAASPCADAVGCGLVGALGAGCLGVPDIDVSPLSFLFELSSGGTATDSIHISDLGRPSLTWLIRESAASRADASSRTKPVTARILASETAAVPEAPREATPHVEVAKGEDDPRDGRGPSRGSGGPDAFGYTWIDSDDPLGPTYTWREISGVGTALSLTDDDHAEVLLPFTFPFYSELELLVKISSNGYLMFGADGDDYSNDPIPDPWTPNNVIAPFWDDLNPEVGGTVYHHYDVVEDEFIVQYDGLYDFYGEGPYTFEVVLKPDGSILFLYDVITGTPATATVGIEDASGTAGLEVVFNAPYVASGLAVLIEDPAPWLVQTPRTGVIPGLGTDSIVLEVDTGDLTAGIYSVTLVLESDDPDEPEVMIPVTLTIDVVGIDDGMPARYVLHGNYPNPFNPRTEILYDLPTAATVTLKVYSVSGRLVRELLDGEAQAPGPYRIQWDGRDDRGRRVASGVYYYRLEADGKVQTSRMVLIK